MKQIINIDENARILVTSEDYILQYRRKSKYKISWRVGRYFPDLISLCMDYINDSPRHADNAIEGLGEIVAIIKEAETRICKIINNQK